MTPGDAIVLLILVIALVWLGELLPKIERRFGIYTRDQDIAQRIREERQQFEEMNRQIEEANRILKESREKEQQRRSSPEFTLLRPSEDNHSATLLRASQSDTQQDEGTS